MRVLAFPAPHRHWGTRSAVYHIMHRKEGVTLYAVAGAKRGGGRGEARGAVRWPQAARAGGGEAECGGDAGPCS